MRHKLLLASVKYLDRLNRQTTDPVLLSELAEGYSKLAQATGHTVVGSIGDLPAAVNLHKRARELIERSARGDPENLVIRERHISILLGQAVAVSTAEAKPFVLLAYQLFESLKGKVPETERLLVLEAGVNAQRANLVNGYGSPENWPYFERTRIAYEKLCARYPENLKYKLDLAEQMQYLVDFIPDSSRRIAQSEQSVALRRAVLQRDPQNPWYQMSCYFGTAGLAEQYLRAGKPESALSLTREAVNYMRRAFELDPDDASKRGILAYALGNLAFLEAEVGNRQEAEVAAMQAITLARDALAKDSKLFWPNWALAQAYNGLGNAGIGDRCAQYVKALLHARKADAFRVNTGVRSMITNLERARRGCGD